MLAKKTYKNQITLPKEIAKDFDKIDYFDVTKREGSIVLYPVEIKGASKTLDSVRRKIEFLNLTEKDVEAAIKWARRAKH